jgi:hypothetical protein
VNPTLLHALYLFLLLAGAAGFAMHLYAQWRFARVLRTRYPDKWAIIAQSEGGPVTRLRIWARLQRVLRTNVAQLFEDAELTRWHRIWRYAPWLAWPCWIGVLAIQATIGTH